MDSADRREGELMARRIHYKAPVEARDDAELEWRYRMLVLDSIGGAACAGTPEAITRAERVEAERDRLDAAGMPIEDRVAGLERFLDHNSYLESAERLIHHLRQARARWPVQPTRRHSVRPDTSRLPRPTSHVLRRHRMTDAPRRYKLPSEIDRLDDVEEGLIERPEYVEWRNATLETELDDLPVRARLLRERAAGLRESASARRTRGLESLSPEAWDERDESAGPLPGAEKADALDAKAQTAEAEADEIAQYIFEQEQAA